MIIVTKHNQIKGLTTAAGLWSSAGVGLAFGIGFYEAALTAFVGIYTILAILQRWEYRVHRKVRLLDVYVELTNTVPINEFTMGIRRIDFHVEGIQFDPDSTLKDNARAFVITLKSQKSVDHLALLEQIKEIPGVVYLEAL